MTASSGSTPSAPPDRPVPPVSLLKKIMACCLFGLLMPLLAVLPPVLIDRLNDVAGRIFYATARKTRVAMFDNARHLLGAASSHAQRETLVRAMMASWCRFLVDMFRFQRVSQRQILAARPRFEGLEAYQAARSAKRGAILVTAHLGNWEYGAVLLHDLDEVLHIVFQPDPNPVVRRVFSFQRAVKHVKEARIEGDPFVWVGLRGALKRDEVVLIQGDRTLGDAGRVEPFIDGFARFPEGPVRLAIASGAPLIPVFVLREEAGLRIHIRRPIFPDAPGVTEETLMQHMVKSIEDIVRRHPDQWLMPHRFWIDEEPGADSAG